MGWSGRAPALPARQAGKGAPKTKEHAMSRKLNSKIAAIGIDIGKNSFHIVGQDRRGALVLRQKWSRGQMEARLANLPPCLRENRDRIAASVTPATASWGSLSTRYSNNQRAGGIYESQFEPTGQSAEFFMRAAKIETVYSAVCDTADMSTLARLRLVPISAISRYRARPRRTIK
jgi:hypothetical protein